MTLTQQLGTATYIGFIDRVNATHIFTSKCR